MTRFDLAPLERGAGLRERLRALAASPLLLVASTIGVLLLLVPLIGVPVALLRPGPADPGVLLFFAFLAVCAVMVLVDGLRKAGTGAGLEGFARANGLELTRSLAAREYAGRRFRSGERIVLHSLRTRTVPTLEVGDSWPMERLQVHVSDAGAVSTANAPAAEGFLRVVLHSPDHPGPTRSPMTTQLDAALVGLLGPYRLELGGGELTVMGSVPLEPARPERVTAAFELAAALARQASAVRGAGMVAAAGQAVPATPAGGHPQPGSDRRARRTLAVIGAVLAMMVVVPTLFAVVMSVLDDHLPSGEGAARAVIAMLLIGITAVVSLVIRWTTAGRRRRRDVKIPGPRP